MISTKTLDLNAISYQDASKLRSKLNRDIDALDKFSEQLEKEGRIRRVGKEIAQENCEKIVLEIVIPDTAISEDIFKVLDDFQRNVEKYEVWYRIGY